MYDDNGNLIIDLNKNVTGVSGGVSTPLGTSGITYNFLDKQEFIRIAGKGTIQIVYDADGNKLQRKFTPEGGTARTTTTTYLGGIVYENDILQFAAHEEGRIRYKPVDGAIPASFVYDYFIKDHLGNVRMVLTEEQNSNQYPAVTFEDANLANEALIYENVDVQRTNRPGAFSHVEPMEQKCSFCEKVPFQ